MSVEDNINPEFKRGNNKGQGQSKIGEVKKALKKNGLTDKNPPYVVSKSDERIPFDSTKYVRDRYRVPNDLIDRSPIRSAQDTINNIERDLSGEPKIEFSRRRGDDKVKTAKALGDNNDLSR